MPLKPLATLLLSCTLAAWAATANPGKADRIFINGNVWTGEEGRPRAQALAVRGPQILSVGTTAEIRRLAEKKTDVVDLKGRFMVPGFNDAHVHFMGASLSLDGVDLTGAWSVEEVQRRIAAFAAADSDRPWIVGRGWSYGAFPGGMPHKKWLDAVVSNRPAWITAYDGRTGWCNSLALSVAGITKATPDPENGVIVRDESGEPTGVLAEDAAMGLVRKLLPRLSSEDKHRALKKGLDLAVSYGVTSIQDASFDLEDLPVYQRVLNEGGLKVRFCSALPMGKNVSPDDLARYKELRDRSRGGRFRFGAVSGVVDGVVESKTAAMLEPYVGGGLGLANWTPEVLNRSVARYDREGFQILLLANGDRAIRMALDAFESASKANGTSGRRHRVEHVDVPQLSEIARFKPLGVIASTQAFFANPDKNTLEVSEVNLGPDRTSRTLPFKLIDDAGAVQAFGSGWAVFSSDVLKGIYCAVTRMTPEGMPPGGWQPQLRITAEAALRHFTKDAAYASFDEGVKGTLRPGQAADLVVLSDDILAPPPERILRARVLLTVLGGNDTYRAREF